jgi:hypothetical protein
MRGFPKLKRGHAFYFREEGMCNGNEVEWVFWMPLWTSKWIHWGCGSVEVRLSAYILLLYSGGRILGTRDGLYCDSIKC